MSSLDTPLGDRMTRCPRPLPDAPAADAHLPGADPDLARLVAGTAGCSPFLAGLIAKEADWLSDAARAPERHLAETIADVATLAPDALGSGMRQAKRRVAVLAALADLGGVWPLETVTGALTDLACACVDATLKSLVAAEIGRGRMPDLSPGDADTAGGMVALAMGKMGAGELNYSSDIDLICLFDDGRFAPDGVADARAGFVRITRRMCALLSDVTDEGYVFRTDLRLRPDASVTPVCLSMAAAERYYESVGRTWERAAYIKASPAGGDIDAGHRFLATLTPFVWRKHLDFAAIEDAHDMRLRIRDHRGLHGALTLEGHNMKLGRGGIREIEFFTQTRQLIAGGRDPSLRVRGTREGLAALAAAGWIPDATAERLSAHYVFHRTVEHRLQMIRDAQTHSLPTDAAGFDRLAAMMDRGADDLRAELTDRLEEVHALTEAFFAPDVRPQPTADWGEAITARWPDYPALRTDRASRIFRRVRPVILEQLQEAARPDEALAQFDRFLSGLPAGVQLFSLFEANPQLVRLLVDICATAPALAQYLSRNAGVLDAVLGGGFFAPWPGVETLTQELAGTLSRVADYETALDAARRWMKERHFRVGVHHLRGLIDAPGSGAHYADLAQACVAALWPLVVAEFERKHGRVAGQGAAVVAMGSLGAGRLNALSDLDLIVIYDAEGEAVSDGRRSLPARTYYARLTQALVTALSAPTAEGRLYEVDMRLRPSGRKGPVATSLSAFRSYQRDEAWTWEHLALTRARPIAGPQALCREIDGFRIDVLAEKGRNPQVRADVADMRRRLAEARPGAGGLEAKDGAGRLMDTDLAAQTLALTSGSDARAPGAQISAGRKAGLIAREEAEALETAQARFWQLQAAARLLTGETLDPAALGEGGRRFVLGALGCDTLEEVEADLAACAVRADKAFASLLEPPA